MNGKENYKDDFKELMIRTLGWNFRDGESGKNTFRLYMRVWTLFCIDNDLVPDTREYDIFLETLWYLLEKNPNRPKDYCTTFDEFELSMMEFLV